MKWSNRVRCVIGLLAVLDGYSAAAYLPASYNNYNNHGDINQYLLHVPNITNDISTPKWVPHMDLGGAYFNDNPHGRGEVDFFVPFNRNGYQLLYGDARGYKKSGAGFEGNFAMGYRRLFRTGLEQDTDYAYTNNWEAPWNMFGVYLSYDILRSQTENWFNQISGGFEYWHQRFFIGANGYVPIIDTTQDDEDSNVVIATRPAGSDEPASGVYGNILYSQGHERALPGVDAQVGYNVWGGLNVFAGAYYFHRSPAPTVWGPKASAEYTFYPHPWHRILGMFNRITFDTEVKHDKPRGTTWYAGMRVTIDLSSHNTHGLNGVARHMVDPIRRDVDIITVSYHDDPLNFFQMNGRNANVKYVSTSTGALDAANDPNVDIIAVNGSITGVPKLTLANGRDMVMTGGSFDFTIDGTHYVINNLGNDGQLTAATNNQLIEVGPGGNDLTLQDLTLNSNSDGSSTDFGPNVAISNYNGTDFSNAFGNLTLKNITSTGALDMRSPSGAATVSVSDSTFNVAFDDGAPYADAVRLEADGGTLTVNSFSDVQVTASGTPTSSPMHGIYNYANGGNIVYPNAFTTTVTVTGGGSGRASGIRNQTAAGSSLTFNSTFSSNDVTVTGTNSGVNAFGIDNVSAGTLTFNGNVNLNTLSASGLHTVYALKNRTTGSGTITYNGTFDGNTLTASNTTTTTNKAAGLFNDIASGASSSSAITFNSSVTSNTISASSDGADASGVQNTANNGTISYNGEFTLNGITATGGDNATTNSIQGLYNQGLGGDITFANSFGYNTISGTNSSTNSSSTAASIENIVSTSGSSISYDGAFFNNGVSAQGSGQTIGIDNTTSSGQSISYASFTDNIISGIGVGSGDTYGMRNNETSTASTITYSGTFSGNGISSAANGTGAAYGFRNSATLGTITLNTFSGNTIAASAASDLANGVYNDISSTGAINFGAYTSNVIIASATGATIGVRNEADNGSISYGSAFSGNQITATTTSSGASHGVWNTTTSSGSVSIGSNFSNNTITASTTSGSVYGLYNQNGGTATSPASILYDGNFSNNTITATTSSGNAYGVYDHLTSTGKTHYTGNFSNNSITATTTSGNVYGNYNYLTSTGALAIDGNFSDNTIAATTSSGDAYGLYNRLSSTGSVTISGLFGGSVNGLGNTITATGTGQTVGMYNNANTGDITFGGAFSYNSISASTSPTTSADSYGLWNRVVTGSLTISGNFNHNSITSSVDTNTGHAYGIFNNITSGATNSTNDFINFGGNFAANTITVSTNGSSDTTSAFGIDNKIAGDYGDIDFAGAFGGSSSNANTITVTGPGSSATAYGVFNEINGSSAATAKIDYNSAFSYNTITVSNSLNAAEGLTNLISDSDTDGSTITFHQVFNNNEIDVTAGSGQAYGILNSITGYGTISYESDFSNNQVSATSTGSSAYGLFNLLIGAYVGNTGSVTITTSGNQFFNNTFDVSGNTSGNASYGIGSELIGVGATGAGVTFGGSFTSNTLTVNGPSSSAGLLVFNDEMSALVELGASGSDSFTNNTFIMQNGGIGVDLDSAALFAVTEMNSNTITGNAVTTSSSYAFVFLGATPDSVRINNVSKTTFESAASNNTLNGSTGSIIFDVSGVCYTTGCP